MLKQPPLTCDRHERRHLARQAACRAASSCQSPDTKRSGSRWQTPRRAVERAARLHSLAFARWARQRGLAARQIAGVLRLSMRTLRHWKQQWRQRRLSARMRGRPAARSSRPERQAVLDLLHMTGPALPLDALRAQFPEMRRAELARLLSRYRRECRRRREARPQRLYWFCAGSVWAMDFVEQLGGLSWVFSVRDLASRRQLLWRSVPSPGAEVVIAALKELFAKHGPPLVLKSDNGSGFIAEVTVEFMAQHGVIPLFSPPRRPQYNGGCERGGSILKGYTYQVAVRAGRPSVCRTTDLEQALQLANRLTRPWGRRGPSPDDVWNDRRPIPPEEREAFQAEVARARITACQQLEYSPDQPLSRAEAARRDRRAMQQALESLGYLKIVARRDPLLRQPPTGAPPARPAPAPQMPATNLASLPAPLALARNPALPAPLTEKSCTLKPGDVATTSTAPEPEYGRPARREPALIRVLRRSLTPLLRILKTANIP